MQIDLTFSLRAVIYPAGDIKGVWMAHALDFDVVTQGNSIESASDLLQSAMDDLVEYRTLHGLSPVELRPAPEEVWQLADAAAQGRLPREPVSIWIRAGKSNARLTSTRRQAKPVMGPPAIGITTYVSQTPPASYASAI